MCGSMSFLLAPNWDAATIFLLSLFAKVNRVYKAGAGTPDTYEKIWLYRTHSLIGLANGIHQPKDPYGNAWPAGSGAAAYAGQHVCGAFPGNCPSFCSRHGVRCERTGPRTFGVLRNIVSGVLQTEVLSTLGQSVRMHHGRLCCTLQGLTIVACLTTRSGGFQVSAGLRTLEI